jgi:hypothetical protein
LGLDELNAPFDQECPLAHVSILDFTDSAPFLWFCRRLGFEVAIERNDLNEALQERVLRLRALCRKLFLVKYLPEHAASTSLHFFAHPFLAFC